MRYESGSAFRRALEARLRNHSLSSGLPLVRLRKMVAFDRLLARLSHSHPGQWVVKGGLALQLRLGDRSRTTKDIDLLLLKESQEAYSLLRGAAVLDLGDWFTFEIGLPSSDQDRVVGGIRHTVHALLDSRTFEQFHVDVGIGDPLVESVDYLVTPDLLSFAEIERVVVPCYPISQQLAEKCHAYTRPRVSGESSRTKDFVDIILLAELGEISGRKLKTAIETTFRNAGSSVIPRQVPPPPRAWEGGFRRMARQVGLSAQDLQSSYVQIQRFLDPVLAGEAGDSRWNPESWSWT